MAFPSANVRKDKLSATANSFTAVNNPNHSNNSSNDSRLEGVALASESTLDIYAGKYVPLWLRAVNESFAVSIFAEPLKRIDYSEYISLFAGKAFLQPLQDIQLPPLVLNDLPSYHLNLDNYAQYWHERLQHEYASQAAQYQLYNLFNVTFETFDAQKQLFKLRIPGLRENAPRVDLGDVLLIRPLVSVLPGSIGNEARKWYRSGGEGIAPGFMGLQHHAVVWSISRRNELVILRMSDSFNRAWNANVIIPVQLDKCSPTWRAVSIVNNSLSGKSDLQNRWLRGILFPTEADGVMQTTLSKGTFNLRWYDMELNYEQKRAAYSAVASNYGTVPYLISGPPGTGKTKTIVETALQLLRMSSRRKSHILICAPSDAAADTVLVRLAAHLIPQQLFRLNSWTRSFTEVPDTVLPFCYTGNDNLFTLPDFETMMSYEVVVTTCRDAEMLFQARLTNDTLSKLTSQLVGMVASSHQANPLSFLHWTALLLDEAAQATEPESLIPLSVVSPPENDKADFMLPQVIMAGDEHQLGPRLATKGDNGHQRSLFQRLAESDLYAKHLLSRQNGLKSLKSSMLPLLRPPFTNLIRNYRSHPAILSMSSALFYHDTLIPERTSSSQLIATWPRWSHKTRWPVLFHPNNSSDDVESVLEGDGTGAGSLVNRGEADLAFNMVSDLLRHASTRSSDGILRQEDIIVMSPFRAQVNHLRNFFRLQGLHGVNIGPLEAFQGLESRVVVLCTTRTRLGQPPNQEIGKFVKEDMARSLGVIGEPKRFNIAITRAKEGLIIIGDPSCLTCTGDHCWRSFLEFCRRNDLFTNSISWPQGASVHQQQPVIGRLERALNYAAVVQAAQISIGNGDPSRSQNDLRESSRRKFGYHERDRGTYQASLESQRSKFELKGVMVDLDEEMWRLQELKMIEDSENIDVDQDNDFANNAYERELDESSSANTASNTGDSQIHHENRSGTQPAMSSNLIDISSLSDNHSDGKKETNQPNAEDLIDLRSAGRSTSGDRRARVSRNTKKGTTRSGEHFDRDLADEFDRAGCETQ